MYTQLFRLDWELARVVITSTVPACYVNLGYVSTKARQ
jgi:hypothetical protein